MLKHQGINLKDNMLLLSVTRMLVIFLILWVKNEHTKSVQGRTLLLQAHRTWHVLWGHGRKQYFILGGKAKYFDSEGTILTRCSSDTMQSHTVFTETQKELILKNKAWNGAKRLLSKIEASLRFRGISGKQKWPKKSSWF